MVGVLSAITIRLIMRLDRLLTAGQRGYLLKRIESLAADFDKLSCDPKAIPKPGSEVQDPMIRDSGF
jgi:hypothetical protein